MYVGVDIGGTKTLVATLTDEGVIVDSRKFPTPENYHHFVLELRHLAANLKEKDFKAGAVGIAGRIDREHGRRFAAGKLAWDNVPVQADLEKIFDCPMAIENDAKLAGLSEALLVKEHYSKVLYLTISTGIGFALINQGKIDTAIGDRGGTDIMVEHRGKLVDWESIGSGSAIVRQYGKKAIDITDETTWKAIMRNESRGLIEIIAITEPDVIIIGGSVGLYFERYGKLLADELQKYQLPLIKIPDLKQAKRPEEAVIFGCYDIAKSIFTERNHAKAA